MENKTELDYAALLWEFYLYPVDIFMRQWLQGLFFFVKFILTIT
jgi:hypothetical protein